MYQYQFRNIPDLETFLLEEALGIDLLIPSGATDELVFFHNGDRMTVNAKTGMMQWEPLNPGELATSKLSMRVHQWFAKGIIYKIS